MGLCAPGPTYTADTLTRLHASGLSPLQIFFVTGADAFADIATWRRYPQVLDMAHFVVVSRPGSSVTALPVKLPGLAGRMHAARRDAGALEHPAIFLVDAHTADVASTDLRRRLAALEPVCGLVPASVEIHIAQHGLYSASRSHPLITTADHLHGQD
jgi:nicotinate-nucleotide adenylyltransferase